MKPLRLSTPHVIVMVGIPGSGKSFFAEQFARTFGAPYLSFNRLRSELFNEPTYGVREQEIIQRIGSYQFDELIKTKHTIVLETATDARTERFEIAKKARKAGYELLFVWVQTDPSTAKSRATKPIKDKKTMTADQYEATLKRFTPPNASEKALVISGKHTYASQLKNVLTRLAGPRTETVQQQPVKPRITEGRHIAIR